MRKIYTFIIAVFILVKWADGATFTVTTISDGGPGSLRQAILSANALDDLDNIVFAIPGAGPHVIAPATPLPTITHPVVIDGYTQAGSILPGANWSAKIMVVLQGSFTGNGLTFGPLAEGSSVKGLSIAGFGNFPTNAAIYINASHVTVAGNLIGLLPDGSVVPNTVGIYVIGADYAVIGGPTADSRNVISGNLYEGVTFVPTGPDMDIFSTNQTVQNNYVGTDLTATRLTSGPLNQSTGNGMHGIDFDGANDSYILDNVIGGNSQYGIGCDATYSTSPTIPMIRNVTIMRNRIGIGLNGEDLGNTVAGVMVINANSIIIGSSIANANIIAYNGTGVIVKDYPDGTSNHSYNVQISYNRIYNNDGMGIDLNGDGPTLNDYNDVCTSPLYDCDLGPNGLQNYPVIDSAYVKDGNLIIKGTLKTDLPNSGYNVVFFNNPQGIVSADTYGYECYIRIGLIHVVTDANGFTSFNVSYPYSGLAGNGQANYRDHIVSFARSVTENTSEFSPAFTVTAYPDKVCTHTVSSITYSVPAVSGATAYTWTVPSGATFDQSAEGNSISVDWSAVAAGDYEICVTASNTCGSSASTCMPVVLYECATDLAISKTDTPDPVTAGNSLTYTLTVTNTGTNAIDATNVVVNDVLPAGLTLTGFTASVGSWSTPDWTIGTLSAGSTATLQLTTTVNPAFSAASLSNTASVSSSTPDLTPGNNSVTQATTVNHDANVTITKARRVPGDPVVAGGPVVYEIWVTNTGPGVAYNVSVTDTHPSLMNMEYSYTGDAWLPWPGTFPVGTMQPGEVTGGYIRATVSPGYSGSLSNTASVDWNSYGNSTETVSATDNVTVGTVADLRINKTGTSGATQNQPITFTISVTNDGPSDAVTVSLSDNFIADITNPEYSLDNATWNSWTSPYAMGDIISGQTKTIYFRGTVSNTASGTLSNTASVSSATSDPHMADNTSTASVELNNIVDLEISKTAPATRNAGTTITYTITVTNNNSSLNAANVLVNDLIDETYITSAQYSLNSGPLQNWSNPLNIGTLNAGATATISITGNLKPDIADDYILSNTASVSSDVYDDIPANNTSTANTIITSLADLTVVKTVVTAAENIIAGQPVRYNLQITNNGPSVAYSVVAMEIPPTGLTLTQYSGNGGATWNAWPSGSNQINVGILQPAQVVNILVEANLDINNSSSLTNRASVSTSTDESTLANNESAPVIVTVLDESPPVISCPADVSISCEESTAPANTGTATATDNFGGSPDITYVDVITTGACADNFVINRTWTAGDGNGNTATCLQIITVSDQSPPSVSCPTAVTVECSHDVPDPAADYSAFVTLGGSASDLCSSTVRIEFVSDNISNRTCSNRYDIDRMYQATDECGNFSICHQSIIVFDDVAPIFTTPADLTISCETAPVPDNTGWPVIEPSNCGGANETANYSDIWTSGPGCSGTGIITRTWTATDQCGNTATGVQLITVEDNTDPQISCITDQTRETDPSLCSYSAVGIEFDPLTTTDNCDIQSVSSELSGATSGTIANSLAGTAFNKGVTTVSWTVTDACGNTAACNFTVTVNDSEFPALSCPVSTVSYPTDVDNCNYTVPDNGLDPTVGDNCPGYSLTNDFTLTSTLNAAVFPTGNTTVVWTVTDGSGHTANCSEVIHVADEQLPVILCQGDILTQVDDGQCNASVNTLQLAPASYSDNCTVGTGNLSWSFSGATSGSGSGVIPTTLVNKGTTQATYTLTDPSGNSSSCSFLISVDDNISPEITTCPASLTGGSSLTASGTSILETVTGFAYSEDPVLLLPGSFPGTATDNCNITAVNYVDVSAGTCPLTVSRTWTVQDAAGLTDNCVQTFEINQIPPDAAVAVNDEMSTWQDVNVAGNVMSNDFNAITAASLIFDGFQNGPGSFQNTGNLTLVAPGNVTAGELSINTDGTYSFNPEATFTGSISVVYQMHFTGGSEDFYDTARLSLTVNSLPWASNSIIANNDENISYGGPVSGNVVVNDRDPQSSYFSVSSFTYDDDGLGSTAEVSGTLATATTIAGISNTGNAIANAGSFELSGSGSYIFTPETGFRGKVTVTYTLCDVAVPQACSNAVLQINILSNLCVSANKAPFSGDDFQINRVNLGVSGNYLNNDYDPDVGNLVINSLALNSSGPHDPVQTLSTVQGGSLILYQDGTYTYTPPVNYSGPDEVTYIICDDASVPACHAATLHFLMYNSPPVAGNDVNTTLKNTSVGGNVLLNDNDPDGDVISVTTTLVSGPGNGNATLSANGSYTYTPSADYTGTDTFTYEICDPSGSCVTATVTITIVECLTAPAAPASVIKNSEF